MNRSNMNVNKTNIEGVYEIESKHIEDVRGRFVKTFNVDFFATEGLESNFKESFYSHSKKNVLRGMHFQKPPYDHAKLVYVVLGEILDVVVDIREDSETFGQYYKTILSDQDATSLYIGKGFAHGFLTLSKKATVIYMTSSVHNLAADSGVRWDSFGFDWPVADPIVSARDKAFQKLTSR